MALRKFTRAETAPEVVSPRGHQAIEGELKKLGKTSASELSDSQRKNLTDLVEQSEECDMVSDRQ